MTIISTAYKLAYEVIFMYKDYQQARDAAWRILIECKVRELPVSLNAICKHLGVRVFSYADAAQMIQKHGLTQIVAQTDGLSFYSKGTPIILFDQTLPLSRNRFTIGHELGHIVLGHVRPGQATLRNREPAPGDDPFETAANQFSVRLLAPACVLWGLGLHTPEEISEVCSISLASARFRAERMEILYKRGKFLTSPLERQLYEQFRGFIARR